MYLKSSSIAKPSFTGSSRASGRDMNDSGIVESGTHVQLVKKEGEYAKLWKLQAQAFVK